MAETNYWLNNWLKYEFYNTEPVIPPNTWYVGLSTQPISGSISYEPVGMGYYGLSLSVGSMDFITEENGSISNTKPLIFPESTDNWGTIIEVFLRYNNSSGSICYHSIIAPSIEAPSGTQITFQAGDLVFGRRAQ